MARKESVAVAGYFPTAAHLVPRIARLVAPHFGEGDVSFMDPCAGEGDAILGLMTALVKTQKHQLYAIEMEATRFDALKDKAAEISYHLNKHLIHGDAFRVTFEAGERGVSLLYLNPPYDLDRVYGRLEQRFLVRFTKALTLNGILLFVVPYYALKSSAELLATEYSNIQCFKFPDEDFGIYKQVVLFAQKCDTRLAPDSEILAQVHQFTAGHGFQELPNVASRPIATLPEYGHYYDSLQDWTLRQTDVNGLLKKVRPWVQTSRQGGKVQVRNVLPDLPLHELLLRTYPVATPPRPAHIAAGIASGIFNGARVSANNQGSGLSDLLVKGTFTQEYRTVEEKKNKEGNITSYVQIQQPKLTVTVLDLDTKTYKTLGSESSQDQTDLSVNGLLHHYGDSLMQVMEAQCPITYDPRVDGHTVTLAETARKPYTAQEHAAKALVTLLGGVDATRRQRQGKACFLLGEIGSGKSTVALVVGKTIDARRPLVVCPPHLLTSWTNECAAVVPEAQIKIINDIKDLQEVAADNSDHTIVSILSREAAKLSHGWSSVGDICPKCGSLTNPKIDHAKKRSRCEYRPVIGSGLLADVAMRLAYRLARHAPTDTTITELLTTRTNKLTLKRYAEQAEQKTPKFTGLEVNYFDQVLQALKTPAFENDKLHKTVLWLLMAIGDDRRTAAAAEFFMGQNNWSDAAFGNSLLYLLTPYCEDQGRLQKTNKPIYSSWQDFSLKALQGLIDGEHTKTVAGYEIKMVDGQATVNGHEQGSLEACLKALLQLTSRSNLHHGPVCDEFLYHAVPEPRRVALAKHIQTHYPHTFDFLILDEAHEYSTDGSAQQRAGHRLAGLGMPTIEMTGSLMNGYAEALFVNMWYVSPDFRKEFSRQEKQKFIDRYGYRKRLVTESQEDLPSNVVAFGSHSDRVQRSERVVGNAPGVLPLFLLRHLLPLSVTLHKADLALDLPPCVQERHLVKPDPVMKQRYDSLVKDLIAQIKKDRFDEELAGKLFGQLAEIPSYLDRSTQDTGNSEDGSYEVRYPESVGGGLVSSQPAFAASNIMPKEQWMLDRVKQELAEGRNVMVFSWHTSLLPRMARLIEQATGTRVPILYADKVATAKRQDWITKQVVNKKARVMVTNPVAIQTGLNNLVHFNTEIWMENCACNPIVYRQATGRVDRIGAQKETRILFPVYADTLQEQLHDLLLRKVAISTATDGLDPESALLASGVGPDEFLTGMSIGKQLWAMLSSSDHEPKRKLA